MPSAVTGRLCYVFVALALTAGGAIRGAPVPVEPADTVTASKAGGNSSLPSDGYPARAATAANTCKNGLVVKYTGDTRYNVAGFDRFWEVFYGASDPQHRAEHLTSSAVFLAGAICGSELPAAATGSPSAADLEIQSGPFDGNICPELVSRAKDWAASTIGDNHSSCRMSEAVNATNNLLCQAHLATMASMAKDEYCPFCKSDSQRYLICSRWLALARVSTFVLRAAAPPDRTAAAKPEDQPAAKDHPGVGGPGQDPDDAKTGQGQMDPPPKPEDIRGDLTGSSSSASPHRPDGDRDRVPAAVDEGLDQDEGNRPPHNPGQDDDNDAEEADEDGETPLIDRPEEPQDVEVKVPSKPKLAGPKTNSMLDDHMKVVSRLEANSSFMGYLVISALIVLVLYLMYHNKKKLIGLVLEGRPRGSGRRVSSSRGRSGSSAQYRKLDNNLEEAMGSNAQASRSHVIY